MSEVHTVFNKSSKQLLSLAKTLKENNKTLEGRVVESLLVKRNVEMIKKRKLKHKFTKHPDPLSSESETSIQPVAYGYSESSLSFNYNKSCDISVTHSEHSTLSNVIKRHSKSPQHISFSSTQSLLEQKITVLPHQMDIEKKEVFENTPLKNTDQEKVVLEMESQIIQSSKTRPATSKLCSKNNEAKKNAIQKKNVDHKLRNYLQRIVCTLEDIRVTMVKGIEPPDGAEDWERVKVRTSEFSARFSRNYLYQLGREMFELQQVTKISGNITNRTAKNIHQRMFSAHQIVLQAFQAYRSHMTTLIANALAEKLQYVIEQTYILCDIHSKFVNLDQTGSSKRETLIDVLTNRCNILLDKIQETIEKRGQLNNSFFSPTTRLSLMGYNVNFKKAGKPKPRKKNALEARLSMYSIASGVRNRDAYWKKTVESLAKDKLRYNHVQSRYKTASFKHRPPTEKQPTVIELPTKSKLFGKRSSCLLRNTPISSPHNEDNILTMVEMQKDKESSVNNAPQQLESSGNNKDVTRVSDCEQQSNNVRDTYIQDLAPRIKGLCQQVCPKEGEAMTQKQLEILLKGLLGMALDEKINSNKETGSKKNGFTLQANAINEVAQKIMQDMEPKKENCGEILENDIQKTKISESKDKLVENKKSLDIIVIKQLENGPKEIDEDNNIIEETPKANNNNNNNRVEFDEENIINTKKIDKNYTSKNNNNKRRQTVTVTGAKNAQLICIRDDDSIIESPDVSKSVPLIKKSNELVKENKELPVPKAQGEVQKNIIKDTIKPSSINNTGNKIKPKDSARSPKVKISRMPKKFLKKLVMVPKTQALNVIQYKLQYSKFTKRNHMYRKSSNVQPWVIVDKISDHLLNDLLLSVAKEIHVDKILENLYRSEFQ